MLSLLISMAGCGDAAELNLSATDMMEGIRIQKVEKTEDLASQGAAVSDFGLRLVQNAMEPGENTLISPLSVLSALAMTMNGAEGETLTQMETVFGMTAEELNPFFAGYLEHAAEQESVKLSLANAIWFKNDPKLVVEDAFLQTNANYYQADIYKSAFDEGTRKDINTWVEQRTDGMIPEVLDEIPEEAIMYLVNALTFEGEWREPYYEYQVHEGSFTTEDGIEQNVELMYSDEGYYLSDENATGFLKYYKGGEYAFVALLPNEGISVEDYVNSLSGQQLQEMLSEPENVCVYAAIPKFEAACDYEMSEVLVQMGMNDAFDWRVADFSRMGRYEEEGKNICLNRVIHKTFISVAEQGTKAGAATVVEATAEGAALEMQEVILDRPFVYMLIDCDSNTPLFIGTLMTVE